ncbi:uncharacterized protein BCR38DRAFT_372645 [Pseudomassariella vexata]|uniref:Azaphilone pigments biosynthesis cluster protein L N-terminal domain-containing protein n=1 Tax=Pseudomassariella vexata TaxID=1141098 RepID=A0A1Y2DTM5_9PEZI|nr:uncharacterized protein BCR38DRAFT_372645 [Pseudomassariella vexata]ORY62628.1 hypothetical protein BCR38DRAFT_372645 [Pseudomassariella vexata]
MADPLSVGASVLAVVTAAVQATKSLQATVKRYKDRDKTLSRLQDELDDLIIILASLQDVVETEAAILELLKGPVSRCSQLCRDFEVAMEKFRGKSKIGLRDWARMEFMRGDINEFMDSLANYKSTITVGLGTITMRTSKLSHQVLEGYSEMISDTTYSLQIHLQRVDEKLARIATDSTATPDARIDLRDEKEVTKQCLIICEGARSYIESLQDQQPSLLQNGNSEDIGIARKQFEAQRLTSQTLSTNRDKIVETIGLLQERLASITASDSPNRDSERSRLLDDINLSKQCLEVCKQASEQVAHQKIHTIGEVMADHDTDQVVVTTLADLFDVRKVFAKSRSTQLVGSMLDETLQRLSADRYSSRFGAVNGKIGRGQPADTVSTSDDDMLSSNSRRKDTQPGDLETREYKPLPNEMRKRAAECKNNK